jgi:DNA-binding CsgD family transcriptional regulator
VDRPLLESTVFDAAVAAGAARTPAELTEALQRAFALFGFDYFRVVEAISDGEARALRYVVGRVDLQWETLYAEERLARQDPRLRRALISSEPFFLSEVLAGADVQASEQIMLTRAQQFGISESYVLPHRDADNRRFAVVLIGPGRKIDGIYRVAVHTLSWAFLLAAMKIEAALDGGAESADRPTLTIRQLQCLEWSRRGKSSADIGKILGLSPRTVDEHCAAACKALDVRTRMQAVAKAISLGLLPYRAADVPSRNP